MERVRVLIDFPKKEKRRTVHRKGAKIASEMEKLGKEYFLNDFRLSTAIEFNDILLRALRLCG